MHSDVHITTSRIVLVVSMIVACGEPPTQDAQPDTEAEPSVGPINTYMSSHFDHVTHVQRALIRGDLDEAHALARWLSEQPTVERLPEGWEPFVEEIKTAARLTSEARTYKAAAAATSAMVKTCGQCHRAVGAMPSIPTLGMKGLPPADPIETVPRMLRHEWAIEKMWVGLINPSRATREKGTDVLTDAPLQSQEITDDAELIEDVGTLARAVHELGKEAKQVDGWDERSLVYGQLLATCAECHRKLGHSVGLE
jgi:cytochrome c553